MRVWWKWQTNATEAVRAGIRDMADKVERMRECQDVSMQVRILQLAPIGEGAP